MIKNQLFFNSLYFQGFQAWTGQVYPPRPSAYPPEAHQGQKAGKANRIISVQTLTENDSP